MNELEMNRELQELLTTLKSAEREAIDSGNFRNVRDLFVIHMAAIEATYDMDSALDALTRFFGNEDDTE